MERRLHGSDGDLLARFDSVREVMERFDALEGWQLTPTGERLRQIFNESDLFVSLSVGEGLLDDLGPADLAALVSCLTHEHRGSDRPPPPRLPTRELQSRYGELQSIWRNLTRVEQSLGLPPTREPSDGFAVPARLWCGGMDLGTCVGDDLSGGDFVRNSRNLVDLLTQIATVTSGRTAASARTAAQSIGRDVVLGAGGLS